jgi:mannosyl-3-phosphoglycerate phosphatase
VVVFSDLDGTLLDHETYSFDAARPALDHIDCAGIPLVLCTSKTRAEIEPIRASLHNRHPFISENGGAVFIPVGYFSFDIDGALACGEYLTIEIGDPYADLTSALARASHSSGVPVRGFSAMTVAEVVSETGLPAESAQRARERDLNKANGMVFKGDPIDPNAVQAGANTSQNAAA